MPEGDQMRLASVMVLILLTLQIAECTDRSLKEVPASEILAKIGKGMPIEYDHVIVTGNLSLSDLEDLPTKHVNRTDEEIKYLGASKDIKVVVSPIRINDSVIDGIVSFNNAILGNITDFNGTNFNNTADFSFSDFNSTANFMSSEFNSAASFWGSSFNSTANFEKSVFNINVDFSDCKFFGPINFMYVIFGSDRSGIHLRGDMYPLFIGTHIRRDMYPFFSSSSFYNSEFNSEANFTHSSFKSDIEFLNSKFNKYANFKGSKFDGYTNFHDAQFNDNACFDNINYSGGVTFTNASFEKSVIFKDSKFLGDSYFSSVKFKGYSDFNKSEFEKDVSFDYSDFRGKAYFLDVNFGKDASISSAKFNPGLQVISAEDVLLKIFQNEPVNYAFVRIEGDLNLNRLNLKRNENGKKVVSVPIRIKYSEIDGYLNFVNTAFGNEIQFEGTKFKEDADFRGALFNKSVDFRSAQFEGDTDFSSSRFLDDALFLDVNFNRKLNLIRSTYGKLYIKWDNIEKNLVYDETAYQLLIENFRRLGFITDADNCYYNLRREQLLLRNQDLLISSLNYMALIFYGYGIKPFYPIVWSIIIIAFFGIFWRTSGIGKQMDKSDEYSWAENCVRNRRTKASNLRDKMGKFIKPISFSGIVFLSGTWLFDPPEVSDRSVSSNSTVMTKLIQAIKELVVGLLIDMMVIFVYSNLLSYFFRDSYFPYSFSFYNDIWSHDLLVGLLVFVPLLIFSYKFKTEDILFTMENIFGALSFIAFIMTFLASIIFEYSISYFYLLAAGSLSLIMIFGILWGVTAQKFNYSPNFDALSFSATVFLSGTKVFIDVPRLPKSLGTTNSKAQRIFILERVLGALFAFLFFLAISRTILW